MKCDRRPERRAEKLVCPERGSEADARVLSNVFLYLSCFVITVVRCNWKNSNVSAHNNLALYNESAAVKLQTEIEIKLPQSSAGYRLTKE